MEDCEDFGRYRCSRQLVQFRDSNFARDIAQYLTRSTFENFIASFADFCFTAFARRSRIVFRSGKKYALPTGWFGFGIRIRA